MKSLEYAIKKLSHEFERETILYKTDENSAFLLLDSNEFKTELLKTIAMRKDRMESISAAINVLNQHEIDRLQAMEDNK